MKRSFFLPVFIAGLAAAASFSSSLEIQVRGVYSGSAGGFELQPVYAGSLLFSESWGDFYLDSALFPGWNLATRELWAGISKLELGYDAGSLAAGIGAAPETQRPSGPLGGRWWCWRSTPARRLPAGPSWATASG